MSTVCFDTDGCADTYRCDLDMYLMTLLSYIYGIIICHSLNAPSQGKNVVDNFNDTGNVI